MQIIAKLQANHEQWEESLITISETLENPSFFIQRKELEILCTKAIIEAKRDKVSSQAAFEGLLQFARENEKQRDENLSTIVAAVAEAGEISTALNIANEIQDAFELLRAFLAIGREQFNQGEEVTVLNFALKTKNQIQDENKHLQAIKIIAQIQAIAEEGEQAVKTVETILSARHWHLPGLALLFVETRDKTNFKKLLIPCAYYLDAAHEMCGYIARMYPETSENIAKVVTELSQSLD
ncbi:MAG: hypothetical protein KME29_33220 [Calothrix sp. FI2-JRJ7]|jgi:hypothetical protein|nr:hypothetical protein [Calothrix sp. FI2-JRJ7]